uniref:Uncharacterized protein n=1 Tax=Plectus sambesii TaxID=2011161 RepID=A0A914V8B1_9BILA
ATMLRKPSAARLRKCRTMPAEQPHRRGLNKLFKGRLGKSLTRLETTTSDFRKEHREGTHSAAEFSDPEDSSSTHDAEIFL